MKRLILIAVLVLPFVANAQEKPLTPQQVKKENAATAIEEKEVAKEKSEAEKALEQGKEIRVKEGQKPVSATNTVKAVSTTKNSAVKESNPKAPLSPAEVAKENAATAEMEKKVANEKTEAEIALAEGKEMMLQNSEKIYAATSVAENSGFARTVGFDGVWKIDLDLDHNELLVSGGTLQNKSDKASNNLRVMVYYADKPFDVKNPELIGTVFSAIDVAPLSANQIKNNEMFKAPVALDTPPVAGTYYPYILLGELNTQTGDYEVKDVKVFQQSITIP